MHPQAGQPIRSGCGAETVDVVASYPNMTSAILLGNKNTVTRLHRLWEKTATAYMYRGLGFTILWCVLYAARQANAKWFILYRARQFDRRYGLFG